MDLEPDNPSRERDSEHGNGDARVDGAEPQQTPPTGPNGNEGAASTAGDGGGGDLMDFLSDPTPPDVTALIAPVECEPTVPPCTTTVVVDVFAPTSGNPLKEGLHDDAMLSTTADESSAATNEARIRSQADAETHDLLDFTSVVDAGDISSPPPPPPQETAPDLLSPARTTDVPPATENDSRGSSPGTHGMGLSQPAGVPPENDSSDCSSGIVEEVDVSLPAGVAPSHGEDHNSQSPAGDATATITSETDAPQASTSLNGDHSRVSGVESNEDRVRELEALLAERESKAARREEETTALLMELQESLQQQMSAKAEAENKSRCWSRRSRTSRK
jgi:hypothetical protein